jgi:hypothetical protein
VYLEYVTEMVYREWDLHKVSSHGGGLVLNELIGTAIWKHLRNTDSRLRRKKGRRLLLQLFALGTKKWALRGQFIWIPLARNYFLLQLLTHSIL